jgi:hypothetical protein
MMVENECTSCTEIAFSSKRGHMTKSVHLRYFFMCHYLGRVPYLYSKLTFEFYCVVCMYLLWLRENNNTCLSTLFQNLHISVYVKNVCTSAGSNPQLYCI